MLGGLSEREQGLEWGRVRQGWSFQLKHLPWSSFLTISLFLYFGVVMYILGHCVLGICNFSFDFIVKRLS